MMDREKLIAHLSAMTDAEYQQLSAEARPSLDPVSASRAAAVDRQATAIAKAQQLVDLRAEQDTHAAELASALKPPAPPAPPADQNGV